MSNAKQRAAWQVTEIITDNDVRKTYQLNMPGGSGNPVRVKWYAKSTPPGRIACMTCLNNTCEHVRFLKRYLDAATAEGQ